MCPNCRAFITTSDTTCPYCNERVGPRAVDRRQPGDLGGLIPHAHFTTVLILLINVVFSLQRLLFGGTLGENRSGALARWAPSTASTSVLEHQWWRLVTAGFLHGGLLHILMNSWVLYGLGAQVEEIYGTPRFLVIYFAGTVGGFCLSAGEESGGSRSAPRPGLMGLIGAMIAYGVVNRSSREGDA